METSNGQRDQAVSEGKERGAYDLIVNASINERIIGDKSDKNLPITQPDQKIRHIAASENILVKAN
jgi:hypothetical protein